MIINCPNSFSDLNKVWKVFCAGPIQGGPDWQNNMPEVESVVWLSPRRTSYPVPDFNYNEQVQWETDALRSSNIVLFWIPEPIENIPGRAYAQTTRFELGENLARGKRIILGAYKDFPGRKYLEFKTQKYENVIGSKVCSSLEECLELLENYINSQVPTTNFTSDTHFSSDRTLELSKRPFLNTEEMDWTMIERWCNSVNPGDTVWHLGDFGESWPLKYLSGNINIIPGNYEREGKYKIESKFFENAEKDNNVLDIDNISNSDVYIVNIDNNIFNLVHEPCSGIELFKETGNYCLFGHIHGRQKIKEFGIDVGVDCNNFAPISIKDILFYINAIENGYYDEEVFC